MTKMIKIDNADNGIEQPEMVFSVGEYIETVNALVKNLKVKVTGEVTVTKVYPSGHCYFTIKDSSPDQQMPSSLECIIWKYDYQMCGVKLTAGTEVI
ncbi:MAG: exodeoxyribonuclease VII large subunit, partial [Candidatus Gribaldobacteria bacterium]|nr:exodeoxyribonuclease VII large subunit [Candidatus Gribaldobacteria bacterium]